MALTLTQDDLDAIAAKVLATADSARFARIGDPMTLARAQWLSEFLPVAVNDLALTNDVIATRVDLSWTHDGANVDRFRIYRREGVGSYVFIAAVVYPTMTYSDTAASPSTEYTYRVDACLSGLQVDGDPATITTSAFFIDLDFSTLGDGAIPYMTTETAEVSGGVAVNEPSLGAELLTNPGLEGSYTGGVSPNLTKTGSPVVAQETGDVHGGSSAQKFTGAAFNDRLNWPVVAGVTGAWYKFSVWGKRTAGSASNTGVVVSQSGNLPQQGAIRLFGADWQQEATGIIAVNTNNIFAYPALEQTGGGVYDTVIVDDGSLKRITYADIFTMLDIGDRNATVKAQPTTTIDGTLSGVIAWANASSSPDTFVLAYWRARPLKDRISFGMMKCVAGVWTNLVTETSAITVSGAWIELRPQSDTSVAMYYNNIQIGATKTIADCPGSHAGFIVTGGNSLNRFFAG